MAIQAPVALRNFCTCSPGMDLCHFINRRKIFPDVGRAAIADTTIFSGEDPIVFGGDSVDAGMIGDACVEIGFIPDIGQYSQEHRQADGETENINQRIQLVSVEIPESEFENILKHDTAFL